MRKIFTIVMAAATAMGASAGLSLPTHRAPVSRADMPAAITETPAGTLTTMQRDAMAFRPYMGQSYDDVANGTLLNVVKADDGSVYFCNWITFDTPENPVWIKGMLTGDTVVFNFPQVGYLDVTANGTTEYPLYVMNTSGGDDGWTPGVKGVKQEAKFVYKDGVYTQVGNDVIALGGPDQNNPGGVGFYGYGEYNSVISPIDAQPVVAPEGLDYSDWCLVNEEGGGVYQVSQDGQDIYVKGLCRELPEAVVTGKIDGDSISLASGQYFGADWGSRTAYFLMSASRKGEKDPDYGTFSYVYTFRPDFKVAYDNINYKTWNLDSAQCLLVNGGSMAACPVTTYAHFTFGWNPDYGKPVQPATPTIIDYYAYDQETAAFVGGPLYLDIVMPVTDVNGNLLMLDSLYYNILYDKNEAYTFEPDSYPASYPGFSATTTDVPLNFETGWPEGNAYPLFMLESGNRHTMVLPFMTENPGVRMVYKVGGTVTYSNAYYWKTGEDVSVGEICGDANTEAVYYNLQGQRVMTPGQGIFVVKKGARASKVVL